jgi:hypothetical protein
MRTTALLLILLSLAGCSKTLRVELLNKTDHSFSVCSVNEGASDCAQIPSGKTAVLQWKIGVLRITSDHCTYSYKLSVPEPFDQYAEMKEHTVRAYIDRDLRLFLVRSHSTLERTTEAEQPNGYPAAALTEGKSC